MLSKKSILFIIIFFLFFTFFPQIKSIYAIYACNESCALNPNGCNAPLICSSNVCRNPSCTSKADCVCPVNGVCSNPDAHYICSTGTSANNGGDAANWTWNCNGLYGGTNASCSENKPTTPTGTCGSFNGSPTNPATPITYTWAIGTGLQVWDSTGQWWYNSAASSPMSFSGIPPGRTVYARTTYDFIYFSATANTTCALPDNPPTATINGKLQQKSGTGCNETSAGNTINVPSFNITTSNNNVCVHPACTAPDSTNYTCTINFDSNSCLNQSPPTWPTSVNVTLVNAVAPGYGFIGWTTPLGCSPAQNTIDNVVAGSSTTKALTFDFSGTNWYKLKSASFVGSSTTSITVPAIVNQYIPGDPDDDATKYFIIGDGGSVLGTTVNPDPPGTAYSSKNWKASSYSMSLIFTSGSFSSYVKSRKEYTKISNLNQIIADGIYVWNDSVDFPPITDSTTIPDFNFILISTVKTITIQRTNFNPTKSVAIIANNITFNNATQTANGIFVAQTVNIDSNSNLGLKIKGNLITQTFDNNRSWSDTSRPSVFIVFDPVQYINLLPYLSTASYEWRQIQ